MVVRSIWFALLSLGCAAAQVTPARVTSPFTAEAAGAFDNGVDLIADPTILEGGWLRSWEEDIDRRVTLADAVSVVTVTTLNEDIDLEQHTNYRLTTRVDRARHGGLEGEVDLHAKFGQPGYASIAGGPERLLNQHFVLFVKWIDDGGRIVPRWHLSPASERVQRRVNSLVERRHSPAEDRRRVIVHESASSD